MANVSFHVGLLACSTGISLENTGSNLDLLHYSLDADIWSLAIVPSNYVVIYVPTSNGVCGFTPATYSMSFSAVAFASSSGYQQPANTITLPTIGVLASLTNIHIPVVNPSRPALTFASLATLTIPTQTISRVGITLASLTNFHGPVLDPTLILPTLFGVLTYSNPSIEVDLTITVDAAQSNYQQPGLQITLFPITITTGVFMWNAWAPSGTTSTWTDSINIPNTWNDNNYVPNTWVKEYSG